MGVAVGSSHLAVPSRTECSGSILALVGVSLLIGHKDGWCLARGAFLLACDPHLPHLQYSRLTENAYLLCTRLSLRVPETPNPSPAWQMHGSTLCGQSSQNTGRPWVGRQTDRQVSICTLAWLSYWVLFNLSASLSSLMVRFLQQALLH